MSWIKTVFRGDGGMVYTIAYYLIITGITVFILISKFKVRRMLSWTLIAATLLTFVVDFTCFMI